MIVLRLDLNKKWQWNKSWKFYVLVVTFISFAFIVNASHPGNIGCLYIENLCHEGIEVCFDDNVIGRCITNDEAEYGGARKENLDERGKTEFTDVVESTRVLVERHSMPWDHEYVQCRLQNTLYAIANRLSYSSEMCWEKLPDEILNDRPIEFDLDGLAAIEQPQLVNDEEDAAIEYSAPNIKYADEVYYPPMKRRNRLIHFDADEENTPHDYRTQYAIDVEKTNKELNARMHDIENRIELRRMMSEYMSGALKPPIFYKDEIIEPENFVPNGKIKEIEETIYEPPSNNKRFIPSVQKTYQEAENAFKNYDDFPLKSIFREHQRPKYVIEDIEEEFDRRNNNPNELHRRILKIEKTEDEPGYAEGGVIFEPNIFTSSKLRKQRERDDDSDSASLLEAMLGFSRKERLDVKKPGPPVAIPLDDHPAINATNGGNNNTTDSNPINILPKIKKILNMESDEEHAPHSVDTEFAHIIVKTPMDSWNDGTRVVAAIADMLNMKDYLTSIRVDRHEIAFRVEKNPNKNASEVARNINDLRFRNNLSRRLGVIVVEAGVGNKTKSFGHSVIVSRLPEHGSQYMLDPLTIALIIITPSIILIVIFTIIYMGGKNTAKAKIKELQSSMSSLVEKDYQELCRARMTTKTANTMPVAEKTILSNTQSDRPPSSRSSTSSWCEEPALTNMDISTGHMVLTYMEDHLRNKGRLQHEWDVLCRYEAEPSARDAALQSQCAQLNRPNGPLPYDHSRVVLNHLSNAEGLDYINASTITDHDPRAPAYVAAQGPLPATIAHFWQMIWEQGAVVIVALCRLQENNESSCARYWPEEGSEVYHIYEVHLVSEHIWCDDYLVRSFYLKNLRTSETRTVTQFHFLSWPQNGIPTSAKALLDFRRKINKSYRGRSCPIVVHSSAGAGRTGAYILLDLVLGRMNKGAREIDIAATLEHLRDQRATMVATRQQFEFVLMAVAEEVHAILKALPQNIQPEKRELDKETVKEHDDENVQSQSPPKVETVKGQSKP